VRLLAVLLPALLMAVPPPAAGAETLALVASDEGEGNLWYAVRIPAGTRHGSMEAVVRAGDADADHFAARFYVYDAEGRIVSRSGVALYGPEYRVKLALEGAPTVEVSVERIVYAGGARLTSTVSWGCPACEPSTSDLHFVDVLAIENAAVWSYAVRSNDAGAWAVDHGNASFVFTERHFEGTLTAQAVDATANLQTSLALENDAALVGFFVGGGWIRPTLAVSTPRGEVACPCEFVHAAGEAAWGPGDYAFRLDRSVGPAMLHAASIRLPPPRT